MKKQKLTNLFENFLKKDEIFNDQKVLQISHLPNVVEHREEQINQIANILAPSLKFNRPSNIFIYGKTGSGKTVSMKHIAQNMLNVADKNKIPLNKIY